MKSLPSGGGGDDGGGGGLELYQKGCWWRCLGRSRRGAKLEFGENGENVSLLA